MLCNRVLLQASVAGLLCLGCAPKSGRPQPQEPRSGGPMAVEKKPGPEANEQVGRDESKPGKEANGKEKAFPAFQEVSRIVVRQRSSEVRTITDPKSVRQVVGLANKHLNGWEVPWYGIPVPAWDIQVYSRDTFLGSFGAGNNFFGTHREGGFFSKSATASEVQEFYRLIGAR
jgi:hypothetical protein